MSLAFSVSVLTVLGGFSPCLFLPVVIPLSYGREVFILSLGFGVRAAFCFSLHRFTAGEKGGEEGEVTSSIKRAS